MRASCTPASRSRLPNHFSTPSHCDVANSLAPAPPSRASRVTACPAGTVVTLIHNEILNPDGTVNRNLANMVGTYTVRRARAEFR